MFRNPKLVGWLLAATILATLGAFALSGDGDDAYDASRTVAAPASAATAGEMVGNLPDIPGNTFLTDDESNNIQIFSAASPSVAFVTNTQLRRQRFSLNVMEIPQGSGTGFVWDKTGLIVTNFHVVYQANRITITLHSGRSYEAEVVGVSPEKDIALLRIDAPEEELHPIPLGDSDQLSVGRKVLAIGNPFALDTTLTVGVVSALGREI